MVAFLGARCVVRCVVRGGGGAAGASEAAVACGALLALGAIAGCGCLGCGGADSAPLSEEESGCGLPGVSDIISVWYPLAMYESAPRLS